MIIPLYFQCGDCGQVESKPSWEKLSKYRYKCRHCQQASKQTIWPAPELRNLLEFISGFDEKSPHYPQVTCVFLSSAFELLLEELLSIMAYQDLLYDEAGMLVDALLEGYQGRSRMFTLYSKIGYGTFHDAVKKTGNKQFLSNWDAIVEARNNVVHGRLTNCENITPDLVERTIADALDVFSQLNNQYNTESLHYRVATENRKKQPTRTIRKAVVSSRGATPETPNAPFVKPPI